MHLLCAYAAAVEAGPLPRTGLDAEFLQLGVGKTAASASLARHLVGTAPDLVLLFGVAGAYRDRGLGIGELCLVDDDCLADEGVETANEFVTLDQLGLGSTGPFAMDAQHSAEIAGILNISTRVRGATVSTCSGTDARAEALARRSGAGIETMEGAAVALACASAKVPLVQLRCISNFAGARDQGEWDIATAASRLQDAVERLVSSLSAGEPSR